MSDKKMLFFGWCTKGTSDKIWGVISVQGEWVTFWGRRDKTLTFKKAKDYAPEPLDCEKMIAQKRGKGYRDTTMEEMNALDADFETRFEEHLILCLMANKFHDPYGAH